MKHQAWNRTARALAITSALAVSLLSGRATAQAPATQTPAIAATAGAPPATPATVPPAAVAGDEGYSYHPDGRRDPFKSLQGHVGEVPSVTARPPGLAGSLISEVSVKGIVLNQGTLVAILQGADSKTYLVRGSERLFDGAIKTVNTDAVLFEQDVNDPLSLVKRREIRKPLRPMEEERK